MEAGLVRGESIGVRDHVSGCFGRGRRSETSGKYPAKAFAVFAVLLLTLSVLPMIGVYAPEAEGYEGESYNVVYHPGNPGDIDIIYNDTTKPGNL